MLCIPSVEGAVFWDQRPLHSYCSGLRLVQMGHFLERSLDRSELQAVSVLLESSASLPEHEYNRNTIFAVGCNQSSESREGILT